MISLFDPPYDYGRVAWGSGAEWERRSYRISVLRIPSNITAGIAASLACPVISANEMASFPSCGK
jgi:hypothetical protein